MPHEYRLQLTDLSSGRAINDSGWFRVTADGTPNKVTITNLDDSAVSTYTKSITRGKVEFRTASTVESVDIFGMTASGYPFMIRGIKPGEGRIMIDTGRIDHLLIVPFDITDDDVTANTETDTGIEFAADQRVYPYASGVYVETADSGITIDVGTDSTSGTNDPDGFLEGTSVAATGMKHGTIGYTVGTNNVWLDLTGGAAEWTMGALFHPTNTKQAKAEGADAAATNGNGVYILIPWEADGSAAANVETLTFTLASSADTAAGYIVLQTHVPLPGTSFFNT